MGVVYLAHDTLLDRHVAVKFLTSADDAVLGRFLVEARATARIQHPNVAALFRVGQLDAHPYLVSEFVRGVSLDRIERPVTDADLVRIGLDMARGLAAAHRRGVLHRDVKPGNAVRATSGQVKLLDFGLAKLSSLGRRIEPAPASSEGLSADDEAALADMTGGALLGTPYFMSPEAWARADLSERSDVFSLGLVLYELRVGRGPFRHVPLADLREHLGHSDAAPLKAVVPDVAEPLAAIVDRCLRRDPGERFAAADDLVVALEALRPERAQAAVPAGNPYRGLRPFEPEHRALFFGRQRTMVRAIERLRVEPFLLVTGDSGVGKSSLCAAGLLPAIADGAFEDGLRWATARLVPGVSPLLATAAALAPLIDVDESELEALLRREPESLGRMARRSLPQGGGLLVYVDQLEELVTLGSRADAEIMAEALGSLAAGLPGVRLLATARSDFLSRLEGVPGLRGAVSRGLFLLAPLGRDEVREAVIGPARVTGVRFAPESMVDDLVDASAGGAMPLLQFALAELWKRRDVDTGVIHEEALDELGGVSGALSRHADDLLARLLPAEREAARIILLRLVTALRTRERRLAGELVSLSPHADRVLDILVRGRLLVVIETVEGTAYEIAHEVLVGEWSTLAGWLAEESDVRALIHRVEAAASDWHRHDRAREILWTQRQLHEVAPVPAERLTDRERAFLDASHRARRRGRWLRRAAILAAVLGALGIWAGARLQAARALDRDIARGLASGASALSAARVLDEKLLDTRARAYRAFEDGRTAEGERIWAEAVELRDEVLAAYGDAVEPLERALLLDARDPDTRARYAALLFERAELAEREGHLVERDELLFRMTLYDDRGDLLERWSRPATLALTTGPSSASVVMRRYQRHDDDLELSEPTLLGTAPLNGIEIEPGSVLLELSAPGHAPVRYPLLAERGERIELDVVLPRASEIPEGFVYVPAGESLVGSGSDESVRTFFNAMPQHPRRVESFFIRRHETTFADWIEFLDALPDDERELRTPRLGSPGVQGMLELAREDGRWALRFQPGSVLLGAVAGERVHYPERRIRAEQDWLRFPVVGVSHDDAVAYVRWLDATGRVPGARLCAEDEWERAARGADDRIFPHGYELDPEDANFVATYSGEGAFGPDEVGSHPASRSPFGVDDMAGNVWEWVASSGGTKQAHARGGSFDYASSTLRIANRESPERGYRYISLGVRVCASPR